MRSRLWFALLVPVGFANAGSHSAVGKPFETNTSAVAHVNTVNVALLPLKLAKLFSDGMVMQRDADIPVIGWGSANANVSVTFDNATRETKADAMGYWRVVFPAKNAGGPFTLTAKSGGESIVVNDILIGDVWIASGQSNMEWKLADANNGAAEVARATDSRIRQFKVPNTWSWTPENDLAGGSWAIGDAKHAGDFTAVGYFFARDLRKAVDVPIGLINNAWSGASIEPYMSKRALGMTDDAMSEVQKKEDVYLANQTAALRAKLGSLPKIDSGMMNGKALWADPALDDAAWTNFAVPGAWEKAGYAGLDGIAWFRKTVDLSADDIRKHVQLGVGVIDDADVTFVNGIEVGRTNSYFAPRLYEVPANVLRVGKNVITVRVTDGGGDGGILGNADQLFVDVGGARRSLVGNWKFKVGVVVFAEDGQHVNKYPTALYNRMVYPLLPFPIKGVIWYQGESNSNNDAQAQAYRAEFSNMIKAWRSEWKAKSGDFPFLWVQLPNYGAIDSTPPKTAGWAFLRESQNAALALPNTGQAIAIDVGEAGNLHPRNKQDVGARLALIARAVAYKQSVVYSGPTYKSHIVRSDQMVIEFEHVAGGLTTRTSDGSVAAFAIAGADQKFVWANARLEGNHVVVSSEQVKQPVAVRYAWANSPKSVTLYNKEGLPAAPFRTDKW